MIIFLLFTGSFLLASWLSLETRISAIVAAAFPPLIAAGLTFVATYWSPGSSTDVIAVPLTAIFSAAGSLPGARLGRWLRRRRDPQSPNPSIRHKEAGK